MKQVWEFARRKGYVDANIFKAEDVKAPQRDTEGKGPLSVEQVGPSWPTCWTTTWTPSRRICSC